MVVDLLLPVRHLTSTLAAAEHLNSRQDGEGLSMPSGWTAPTSHIPSVLSEAGAVTRHSAGDLNWFQRFLDVNKHFLCVFFLHKAIDLTLICQMFFALLLLLTCFSTVKIKDSWTPQLMQLFFKCSVSKLSLKVDELVRI